MTPIPKKNLYAIVPVPTSLRFTTTSATQHVLDICTDGATTKKKNYICARLKAYFLCQGSAKSDHHVLDLVADSELSTCSYCRILTFKIFEGESLNCQFLKSWPHLYQPFLAPGWGASSVICSGAQFCAASIRRRFLEVSAPTTRGLGYPPPR